MKRYVWLICVVILAVLGGFWMSEKAKDSRPVVEDRTTIPATLEKVSYAYCFDYKGRKVQVVKKPGNNNFCIQVDDTVYRPKEEWKGYFIVTVDDPSISMTLVNRGTCLWIGERGAELSIEINGDEAPSPNAEVKMVGDIPVYTEKTTPLGKDEKSDYFSLCFIKGRHLYQIIQNSARNNRTLMYGVIKSFREQTLFPSNRVKARFFKYGMIFSFS